VVNRGLDKSVGFLDAAVDDANRRRVSIWCYGGHRREWGCGWPGRPLGQSDIFRLNDLKNVRIIEDEVLQALARNLETNRKAVGQDGSVERCAVNEMQNLSLIKLCKSLYFVLS
jgi:hypothetical protein